MDQFVDFKTLNIKIRQMLVVFCCHAIKNKVWHVQVLMHIYISSRSLKKKKHKVVNLTQSY